MRIIVNTPPQHGKSTLIFHWIAHVLLRKKIDVIYATYNAEFAEAQMHIAKPVAERAGVRFARNSRKMREWRTELGGTLVAAGIGGGITGRPGGVLVIDDPIKGWEEAQSAKERERLDGEFKSSILTRSNAETSVVVVQTRWHEDDISSRLIKRGWTHINLKAIQDDGTALWPERRPLEWLEEQRSSKGVGEFIFSALYQGEPRPRGGRVFEGAHYYDHPPVDYRTAIGLDLAYTSRTSADYSVSIVLAQSAGKYYVLDLARRQVSAPEFAVTLKHQLSRYPYSQMKWIAAGTEKGAADFMIHSGLPLTVENATTDKFMRSTKVAAAWNEGRILVPRNAPWTQEFLSEVLDFTGVSDYHDDQVDALAAAYSALSSSVTGQALTGIRRTSASLKGYY